VLLVSLPQPGQGRRSDTSHKGFNTPPDDAHQRYQRAVGERRIVTQPDVAGTCHLFALDLPPDRVAAVTRRLNSIARNLKTSHETRTMDQLRADALLDLLEGDPTVTSRGPHGVVDIRVDLATLTRLCDTPGDLAGYGPVIADIARRVTQHQQTAQWRYTVTDPATGSTIVTDITRRRPTATQRRHIETRATTCVFPGCRMPATTCDIDHHTPWSQGGPTHTTKLDPLCRHDHTLRHLPGWTYHPLPNGDHQWITQLGHTYTTSGQPP
jgi:hypothetical protein